MGGTIFYSWTDDYEELSRLAATFDKSIKLYTKDNWIMKFCAWFLFIVSFGQFKRETFLQMFATTLAHAHFYPKEWNTGSVKRVMVHEAEHTRQFRLLGLGIHPLVGLPGAALLSLASPLPAGLCWGRKWMELEANKTFWRYALRNLNWNEISVYNSAQHKAHNLSSAAYLWAWPRSWAEKAYKKGADEVIKEWQLELMEQ